jgi:hypothetical protein
MFTEFTIDETTIKLTPNISGYGCPLKGIYSSYEKKGTNR